MNVAGILKRKAFRAAVVAPTLPISEVLRVLVDERSDATLVVDPAGKLLGIVAEHAIVESLAAHGAGTLTMTAGQLVTRGVRTVAPRTSLTDAMRLMIQGHSRHLPVVAEGELIGLISLNDVVRARMIEEQVALAA